MCGIAGFFNLSELAESSIEQSQQALARRGPDARGFQGWDQQLHPTTAGTPASNGLIHTRLAILDTRSAANQPMTAEDSSVWLCYNGEVYGWQEHRKELEQKGYRFRTHSDTEFILQGYRAWGINGLLQRLRGMFAFAIVDLEQRKVYCARDRFGLKPLIYSYDGKSFQFASLVRAILPLATEQGHHLSPAALDAYLAHRYIPAPMTIFNDVLRLENGHLLTFDLSTRQLTKESYWAPEASGQDWQKVLDEAIAIRTASDRPVGVFLSGGIDSSVVASRLSALGYQNIHAFTAAFPGSDMDESEQAARIAQQIGLPHTAVNIPRSIAEDFEQIVEDFDEPFADPSGFPLWYLSREASKTVKVVLNGDGGDELFAGYKRYPKHARSAFRRHFRLPFLPLRPTLDSKGTAKILAELSMSWQEAYGLRFSGLSINQRLALQPKARVKPVYWRNFPSRESSPIKALLDIDLNNYLAEYILRKADLMTMAHGLEGRSPLIDHEFYQSVIGLKDEVRFTEPAKNLFAPICEPLGPDNPLKHKKKGFNPPLHDWLTVDLRERMNGLGDRLERQSNGQLSSARVDELTSRYLKGEKHFAEQLLQLLVLECSLAQLQSLSR